MILQDLTMILQDLTIILQDLTMILQDLTIILQDLTMISARSYYDLARSYHDYHITLLIITYFLCLPGKLCFSVATGIDMYNEGFVSLMTTRIRNYKENHTLVQT